LARGREDDILLINRQEGLSIDAPCQAKQKSEPNDDYQQATRSDDRTFRLVRMPIEACRLFMTARPAPAAEREWVVQAQRAPAAEEMPSFEAVKEFARQLFEMSKKQGLSERETANHLASSMWWSEKMQVLCPSYFYVNPVRARYDYLLRLETWNMYYGVGKTATAILNEATTRRNENFNNVVGSQKGAWCQSLKEFGIKHFGWAPLFEVIKDQ
jgi:hypothetical protein